MGRGRGEAGGRARRGPGGSPRDPFRVAVGQVDDAGGGRRCLDRLGQERTSQAVSPALPVGPPKVGPWKDDLAIVKAGGLRLVDARGEGIEERVLVFLGGRRCRPPDVDGVETAQRLQPVSAGVRPAIAKLGPGHGGQPPPDRRLRGADVEDRLGRQPEARQPGGQGLRGRSSAIDVERLDAFDPFADLRQLDRGGGQGSAQFEDEDTGTLGRDGSAPLPGTVGHEPHRAKQLGGAGGGRVRGHRVDGTRAGRGVWCGPSCA